MAPATTVARTLIAAILGDHDLVRRLAQEVAVVCGQQMTRRHAELSVAVLEALMALLDTEWWDGVEATPDRTTEQPPRRDHRNRPRRPRPPPTT